MARPSVQFKLPTRLIRKVQAQEAKTFLLLTEKGSHRMVAFDFRGGPPFRLPPYGWALKQMHGLNIETKHDVRDGGSHHWFMLHRPVEIAE